MNTSHHRHDAQSIASIGPSLGGVESLGEIAQYVQALKDQPLLHSDWKRAWMFVGAAFQNNDPHCVDCGHCVTTREPRPYGEGTVYEEMSECSLNAFPNRMPEQCPAYQAMLEEQQEDQRYA